MDFDKLTSKYKGEQLVKKLKASWPNAFARSLGERNLCSALEILRWMAVILEENGRPIIWDCLDLAPMTYALTDYPIPEYSDAEIRDKFGNILSSVYRVLSTYEYGGNPPDLFDLLEGRRMVEFFWSKPPYLLYTIDPYKEVGKEVQFTPLSLKEISEISRDGLVHIKDPRMLSTAVEEKAGLFEYEKPKVGQLRIMTPPEFIRVLWDNTSWDTNHSRETSFDTLQQLTIRHKKIQVDDNVRKIGNGLASYRLVCIARIPLLGEEPLATHLYNCNGRNFQPPNCNGKDQNWSCGNPGKYYLIYFKSDEPRYCSQNCRVEERTAASNPDHPLKQTGTTSNERQRVSIQNISTVAAVPNSVQNTPQSTGYTMERCAQLSAPGTELGFELKPTYNSPFDSLRPGGLQQLSIPANPQQQNDNVQDSQAAFPTQQPSQFNPNTNSQSTFGERVLVDRHSNHVTLDRSTSTVKEEGYESGEVGPQLGDIPKRPRGCRGRRNRRRKEQGAGPELREYDEHQHYRGRSPIRRYQDQRGYYQHPGSRSTSPRSRAHR
ncbi:hypothetical protein F5Y00DRAFT_259166 [Daldinia vernicosa]|uniref:uncharacterized protein n=1 Tax=Daldinia vernicosa TaxID=114800 RepID=UPI002007BC4F|nr:uncharacterized protein F5Y00DRAFT_259166 [Daldinia vernicosa]KAI0851678.1 hypothetical protein F5Y00DRAFT_259166 [Daldinia vernicosa]